MILILVEVVLLLVGRFYKKSNPSFPDHPQEYIPRSAVAPVLFDPPKHRMLGV